MEPFTPLAGYASLLGLSFLASTVLPVGSEWLVVALLLQGFEPISVVGDPLCALAGLFRTPWRRFALLVFLDKLVRYIAVAWVTIAAASRSSIVIGVAIHAHPSLNMYVTVSHLTNM